MRGGIEVYSVFGGNFETIGLKIYFEISNVFVLVYVLHRQWMLQDLNKN